MVTEYHIGPASEEADTYFANETARFARLVVFNRPPSGNTQTTTYESEVCVAEPVLIVQRRSRSWACHRRVVKKPITRSTTSSDGGSAANDTGLANDWKVNAPLLLPTIRKIQIYLR
jgi:hypothetical protein